MTILVTGTAGFIGFHTAKKLLEDGVEVVGVDNINDYYSVSLKKDRNSILEEYDDYSFYRVDVSELDEMEKIFSDEDVSKICHLAAQAGVRYSVENPHAYERSNLAGFTNMLEMARHNDVENFVYASSSSVYGGNDKIPYAVGDDVLSPISYYAATKVANEVMAHSYHHLYGLNCVGLRFFTVYGPWGRPDMAMFLFADKMVKGEPIDVYNFGDMRRDFTYIDDIVEGVVSSLEKSYDYEIFNLGNNTPGYLFWVRNPASPETLLYQRRSPSCHLAAQAGVRYSVENPHAYERSNLAGFTNMLEMARHNDVENFVYASSSSVYGGNDKIPYAVGDDVLSPISYYAATKVANEVMAHSYHHLYGLNCVGLRFFTVYGPWGRPDMAMFLFADKMVKGEPIDVYNFGDMRRDFTYIDDIVEGVVSSLEKSYDYEIFNLGNNTPVELMDFIGMLEEELGIEAEKNMMPMQPGDMKETYADITRSQEMLDFEPKTDIREGIKKFVDWYKEYYDI